jgi:hypothetical protein
MKYFISQVSTPQQLATPNANNQTVDLNVILALIVGGVGALGIPKLVQMFVADKVDGSKAERRRDDIVLESVLEVNKTMLKASADNYLKMMEFTQTLVSEISMMREVISNNTNVMEKVRVAGEELKEEMHFIKVQMSAPRNNDIM